MHASGSKRGWRGDHGRGSSWASEAIVGERGGLAMMGRPAQTEAACGWCALQRSLEGRERLGFGVPGGSDPLCFFFLSFLQRSDLDGLGQRGQSRSLKRTSGRQQRCPRGTRWTASSCVFFLTNLYDSDCGTPLLAGLSRSELRLEFNQERTRLPTKKTNDRWNSSIFNL
jgi:hypothetical protein